MQTNSNDEKNNSGNKFNSKIIANVYDENGKVIKQIELNKKIFGAEIREDLITRAVLSDISKTYQPKGVYPKAGFETSARYRGRKDTYGAIKNRGISRLPREILPDGRFGKVRIVPWSKGGHRAHPPKVQKILHEKINKKEYRLAMISALSASASVEHVKNRGHLVENKTLPIIVSESALEKVKKTKQAITFLKSLNLTKDLERVKNKKHKKTGVGKRINLTKYPKSALLLISEYNNYLKSFENIPGIDVKSIHDLEVHDLAPGAHMGRLLIISEEALSKLEEKLSN
ncbi:MAG: 50S ribosomal protein L4 [Candidatus Micrarchaeota archaeon]|nr:50S ribosomal protein L4 [Candidatus Micrarchaeota archaeon]